MLPFASVTRSQRCESSSKVFFPGWVVINVVCRSDAEVVSDIVGSTIGGIVVVGGGTGSGAVGGGVVVVGGTGIPVPAVLIVSMEDTDDIDTTHQIRAQERARTKCYGPSAGSLVMTSKSYDVCDCRPVIFILVALVLPPY
jgi:hypothetical protein